MEGNNTFIFNLEWYVVLMEYPTEVRFEVYEAIMRYALSGTLSDMKPLAKMAFSFIRKEMDYNRERYQATVEKRREAGRKGGSARQSQANEANACDAKQTKQSLANEANAGDAKQTKQSLANEANAGDAKQTKQMLNLLSINDNDNDNDNVSTTERARARGGAAYFERILENFFKDQIAVESFCMTNRISPDLLRRLAREVVMDWRLTDEKHEDEQEARQHLLKHIRLKLKIYKNGTKTQDRQSKRRGADSAAVSAEDYTGEI